MAIQLYNTLTRKKEPFVPIDPANVRMYVCGPTVYDDAHIGNARPVIVFDLLFRLLRHAYGAGHVTYARNITDLDDKINKRAHERGVSIQSLTEGTTARFHAAVDALGCLRPTVEPRATHHIEEMKALCEALVKGGHAYVAEDHVLFSVPSMADYGKLSKRPLDDMIAGARVDVAPYKRSEMDFVLWKPSVEAHEPGWPSPCGIAQPGRPGWHIECSAMSMAKLLTPFGGGLGADPARNVFDIHGGGIDLVFPHHENEVAQSTCAFGTHVMANVWMHNGFLQVEGEKMSKSLGNFVTIDELLNTTNFGGRKWLGAVLRYTMMKPHYRQPLNWTVDALNESEAELKRWSEIQARVNALETTRVYVDPERGPTEAVARLLSDDLNVWAAITHLRHLAKEFGDGNTERGRELIANCEWLGIDLNAVETPAMTALVDQVAVDTLVADRLAARKAKNFAESDRIRDELAAMGIQLKDGKDPATGEPVTTWEVMR